jgi:hypothetical protein
MPVTFDRRRTTMRYLVLLKALTIPDTPPSPELMAAIAALGEDAKNAGVLARPVANRGVAALLDSVEPIHQAHAVDSGQTLGVVVRPVMKPSRDIAMVKNTFDIALPLDQGSAPARGVTNV